MFIRAYRLSPTIAYYDPTTDDYLGEAEVVMLYEDGPLLAHQEFEDEEIQLVEIPGYGYMEAPEEWEQYAYEEIPLDEVILKEEY